MLQHSGNGALALLSA